MYRMKPKSVKLVYTMWITFFIHTSGLISTTLFISFYSVLNRYIRFSFVYIFPVRTFDTAHSRSLIPLNILSIYEALAKRQLFGFSPD